MEGPWVGHHDCLEHPTATDGQWIMPCRSQWDAGHTRSDRRRLGRSERAKAEKQTGQPGSQKQQGVTRPRAQSGACSSGSLRSYKTPPLVTHQPGGAPRVSPCGAAPRARPACSPAPPLDTRLRAPGKSLAGQGSPTLGYPTPAPRTCRARPARPLRPGGAARAPRARSLPPPARAAARPRRCPAPCLRPAATSVTDARRAAADPARCAPVLCGQRRRLAHCARSGAPVKRSASRCEPDLPSAHPLPSGGCRLCHCRSPVRVRRAPRSRASTQGHATPGHRGVRAPNTRSGVLKSLSSSSMQRGLTSLANCTALASMVACAQQEASGVLLARSIACPQSGPPLCPDAFATEERM